MITVKFDEGNYEVYKDGVEIKVLPSKKALEKFLSTLE